VNNYPVQAAVPTHLGCRGDSQQMYCKESNTFQQEYELSKLPCQSYTQAAQEHEPQGDGLQGRHVAVVSMQCTVWGRSVIRSVIWVLLQKEGGVSLQRTQGSHCKGQKGIASSVDCCIHQVLNGWLHCLRAVLSTMLPVTLTTSCQYPRI